MVRARVQRWLRTGSSSGALGIILKKLGMTAARVELRRLLLASLMLRVGGGRIGGDGMALDRVSMHVRRKTYCVGGRHIVPEVWEKIPQEMWQHGRLYFGMIR